VVSERWQALRLDDIEPIAVAGVNWRPLRRTLGVRAFGINAYVAKEAGENVVEEHTEGLRHEEVYIVLSGRATFTLDGTTHHAPKGTVVYVRDPEMRRHARADVAGTTVLAIGGRPGEPYAPSAWEWTFYAQRYRDAGDWEAAMASLEDGVEAYPDNPGLLYNLACFEALAGRQDDALEHLRASLELDPSQRDWALQDEDLASLRHEI
jgi:tetratricopeptide (TPR) repeat protein